MAERQPPSVWDVWLARGLLVGGLWFAGTGLWDLIRAEAMRWDMLLMHALVAGMQGRLGEAWRLQSLARG